MADKAKPPVPEAGTDEAPAAAEEQPPAESAAPVEASGDDSGDRKPVDEANADFGERKNSLIYGTDSEQIVLPNRKCQLDFGICIGILLLFAVIFAVLAILLYKIGNQEVFELKREKYFYLKGIENEAKTAKAHQHVSGQAAPPALV